MRLLAAYLALALNPARGIGTSTPPAPPPAGDTWEDDSSAQWENGATLQWESS